MVFSSLIFLFAFLPAVLGVYYIVSRNYRNVVLLLFSYLFYLWGGGWFLGILVLSTIVDYELGLLVDRSINKQRFWWVFISILFNLSLLIYFKYTNFFVAELNKGLSSLGFTSIYWISVVMPIGISFFTFQKISYIVDVYRGTRRALTNFIDFSLYVALFPKLIAGPIVRFYEISEQFKNRTETLGVFYQGILRFCWGLMKKAILAAPCGEIADAVFSLDPGALDTKTAWLGAFAYTLQIYFDFSAYTDMAIGLGMMFGFKLPENFNRPYSALSITDFWRRWHITLTNFFRDYLYIPLGGNRKGTGRTYFNLMLVFILCGLWHGANWTFLLWGMYHGGLLIIERLSGLRTTEATSHLFLRRSVTLILVIIGWTFFRANGLEQVAAFLKAMFSPVYQPLPFELRVVLNNRNLLFFLIAALVIFLPRGFSGARLLSLQTTPLIIVMRTSLLLVLVMYSIATIASGSFSPFLYFQF